VMPARLTYGYVRKLGRFGEQESLLLVFRVHLER
jgi:hypothetical protein